MRVLIVLFLTAQLVGCAAVTHRDQIGVLLDYGNNQESQEKVVSKETKNFERAKDMVLEEDLKLGASQESIEKKIGSPVIVEHLDQGQKWSYKSGNANWMNGEVVRFYFNSSQELTNWECKNFEC